MTRKHDSLFSDHRSQMTRKLIQAFTGEGVLYQPAMTAPAMQWSDDSLTVCTTLLISF